MSEQLKGKYQLCQEIGRGRFATVFRCFHLISNEFFACKVIDKRLVTDSIYRDCLRNEPNYMALLSPHPNILQIFDVFENDYSLSMVVELCEPLTLLDRIIGRPLPETEAASIMKQLLEAIAHCHRHGIAHKDIKPDNILFDSRNNLKVADFGIAEWFGEGGSWSGVVGTKHYTAPELWFGMRYNEKVDVWSCGVVLYTMLSGIPPSFEEAMGEIFVAMLSDSLNLGFPFRVFSSVSSGAKDLMRKMLCFDPSRRLSAEEALRHPWILSGGKANFT